MTEPFRPIHYLGNKSRVLDAIEAAVEAVAPRATAVCDLFSGSGVVAQRLGRSRRVLALDIQEYSRILCSAVLHPQIISDQETLSIVDAAITLSREGTPTVNELLEFEELAIKRALDQDLAPLAEILEHPPLQAMVHGTFSDSQLNRLLSSCILDVDFALGTVIFRYYGGLYFSYRQALQLDALAQIARGLPPEQRDIGLAAVLSTVSDMVTSVGNHFAQPVRPRSSAGQMKKSLIQAAARRRRLEVIPRFHTWLEQYRLLPASRFSHMAERKDFRVGLCKLSDDVGVVYADPPYTRDHYSRFYHVLETIAVGDEPGISSMSLAGSRMLSRAAYRQDRHQSPFCIRSQVETAFEFIFARVAERGLPLVLSYSPLSEGTTARPQTRLLSIDEILELAAGFFKEVAMSDAGRIAHSKFNASHLNASTTQSAEVLLSMKP